MTAPETVRITATDPKSQGQFVVINAADFDPDKHQAYSEPSGTPKTADAEPEPTQRRGRGRPPNT